MLEPGRKSWRAADRPPPSGRMLLGVAVVVASLAGCGTPEARKPGPIGVVAAPAVAKDVPVYGEWVGNTVGFIDAKIRPQVKGYVLEKHYAEGGVVEEGELLFQIDPRSFQAQLAQAKASLGEARAMLGKSELDVKRYRPLAEKGAVSQQELDDAIQARLRNQAAVAQAQAEVQQAQLDLDWTRVTSPIRGVAGIAVAQVGDLVDPTVVLTTVSQLDPIKVEFQISEQEYLQFASQVSPEKIARGGAKEGNLELFLADGSRYAHRGTASVVGLGVDPRTGTLTIEGLFANPENLLRPGQYAKVRAVVKTEKNALLVPQRAVMEVQGSHQLAVVGDANKVEIRPVEVGPRSGPLWVIAKGLQPGEKVVVDGVQKVRPGATVALEPSTPAVSSGPPSHE